jgi:hypothetical protein
MPTPGDSVAGNRISCRIGVYPAFSFRCNQLHTIVPIWRCKAPQQNYW